MKVLVYSHDSTFYGAPKSIFELTNALQKKDYVVSYVIPGHGKLEDHLIDKHYEYYILPNPQWVVSEREPKYSRWYYFKHIVKSLLIFLISMYNAYRKHIKIVKKVNPDLIIVNTSVAPLGLYIANRLKIRSVLWMRESLCNKDGIYVPILSTIRRAKRIFSSAKVIICPSEFLKKLVKKTFGLSKTLVIPNAVDFNPCPHENNFEYTFGLVGWISERKGQLEFLETMIKKMPNAKLIVYGEGTNDYSNKIYDFASHYPEKVRLYGYESDLNIIYSSFDIYVNMGIDETFGRTTVEAMRAGKLVFGRRSGATPEIIKDGENGFLFDKVEDVFDILRKFDTEKGREKLQAIRKCGHETSMAYMPSEIAKRFDYILKNI